MRSAVEEQLDRALEEEEHRSGPADTAQALTLVIFLGWLASLIAVIVYPITGTIIGLCVCSVALPVIQVLWLFAVRRRDRRTDVGCSCTGCDRSS